MKNPVLRAAVTGTTTAVALVLLVGANGGPYAAEQDSTAGSARCDCHLALHDVDPTAQIGAIQSISGGTAAWYHGPDGPDPAAALDPISFGILPLVTGAGTSMIVTLGQSCQLQLPPYSEFYIEDRHTHWCAYAREARSPTPPPSGPETVGSIGLFPRLTLPLLLGGGTAAAGVRAYFAMQNDENPVSQ